MGLHDNKYFRLNLLWTTTLILLFILTNQQGPPLRPVIWQFVDRLFWWVLFFPFIVATIGYLKD